MQIRRNAIGLQPLILDLRLPSRKCSESCPRDAWLPCEEMHPPESLATIPMRILICEAPLRNYPHIDIYIYSNSNNTQTTSTSRKTRSLFASIFRNVNGKVSHGIFPCPSSWICPASILQDKVRTQDKSSVRSPACFSHPARINRYHLNLYEKNYK